MIREKYAGQAAVFFCAVLWSSAGLCIKLVDWHPFVITGARSLVAAFFLLALRFLQREKRRHPFNLLQLWGGGLCYGLTMFLFVLANKMTTAASAILLQYSAPVWAALFGRALASEKLKRSHWISLVMVSGGLVLFFRDSLGDGALAGNIIAAASGICFGANSAFLRVQKGSAEDSFLLSYIITGIVCIPFVFFFPPEFTLQNTAVILFLGIFQIGAASLLFAYGIRRLSALQSMLTAAIEPVLNPVWVFLAIGEKPAFSAMLGGAVIIAAVLVSSAESGGKRTDVFPKQAGPDSR